jgi:hypothetical protein
MTRIFVGAYQGRTLGSGLLEASQCGSNTSAPPRAREVGMLSLQCNRYSMTPNSQPGAE